jgi:hypothetical protein
VSWAAHSGTGAHYVQFRSVNSSGSGGVVNTYDQDFHGNPDSGGLVGDVRTGIALVELVAAEAVHLRVGQNSGGNLNITYAWSPRIVGLT